MDNYQQACGYAPVSIIEFMIIFSYTDNQGNLLGNRESGYEPWGSSILGAWFSSWYIVSIGTGHIAQSPQSGPDGVLLSRQSLFCLFPPSRHVQENLQSDNKYFVHLFKRILRIYVTEMNHKSLKPKQLLTNTPFSFSIATG